MQVASVETLNNILCFVRGLILGGAFRTSTVLGGLIRHVVIR